MREAQAGSHGCRCNTFLVSWRLLQLRLCNTKGRVNRLGLGCRRPKTLDTMPLPLFLSQNPEGGHVGGDPSPPTAVKLVCSRMGPHSGEWGDAGGV